MIGHLELAIGMLTSHEPWAWLIKIWPWSRIFLRCIWAGLDFILNAECLAWIDWIDQIFDYECNQCLLNVEAISVCSHLVHGLVCHVMIYDVQRILGSLATVGKGSDKWHIISMVTGFRLKWAWLLPVSVHILKRYDYLLLTNTDKTFFW